MRRAEDAAAVWAAVDGMLPTLFCANALPDRAELEREAAKGCLYVEELPDALLLFLRRDGFYRLRFLLRSADALRDWRPSAPTVCELACRASDRKLLPLAKQMKENGWRCLLRRVRLSRKPAPALAEAVCGESCSLETAQTILKSCFSPLTGCLPTEAELADDLAQGRLLHRTGGLLRFTDHGGYTELRHLAVLPECRRQGSAHALVAVYLAKQGDRRSRVWTGADNEAALHLYAAHGYVPDGWQSQVLFFDNEPS